MAMKMAFYGPPGTGKSETARYLAEIIDRDLMVCKASDILDMFVGSTERNLAAVFSQAEAAGAVLLIDEADSFLFDRNSAARSWEVTQTNEFLTQLENYTGFIICTTNRLPKMDSAVLRRFNRKIGFDYLTPEGNQAFYDKILAPMAGDRLTPAEKKRLAAVRRLTPGDFKVVRDQHFLTGVDDVTHAGLIAALEAESLVKSCNEDMTVAGFTGRRRTAGLTAPA